MQQSHENPLFLDDETRRDTLQHTVDSILCYLNEVTASPVTQNTGYETAVAAAKEFDFAHAMEPSSAIDAVVRLMRAHQVHTPHPRYFGLFNPASTTMGIAADALTAAFNPQLAAWSAAPFAVEVERHLVDQIAQRFGVAAGRVDGTFTTGGAEANLTGVLCALHHRFPTYEEDGLYSLASRPVIYVSAESHHSIVKAAGIVGLGKTAVRRVPVLASLSIDTSALEAMIREDRKSGMTPFMVVATIGTTGTGSIDALPTILEVARRENLWVHADAAWGGFAAFVPELTSIIDGCERADSITFDTHKMLSVPMGAGLFFTQHRSLLHRAFRVNTDYMPAETAKGIDPYTHSIQWSRRFIGLKVLLSLAVAGWEGYATMLRTQVELGNYLKNQVREAGWTVVNDTPLPVVCFNDPRLNSDQLKELMNTLVARGNAWISIATTGAGTSVLRACITNFRSTHTDIDILIEELAISREAVQGT